MGTPTVRVEVNGSPATAGSLQHLALVNYGHFTAMQVRDSRVRGLSLHLARLDGATRELFGTGLDGGLVRSHIRHALASDRDASVRVIVFWPDSEATPAVMVTVRPPAEMPAGPQRLMSAPYQRPAPHIKHIGGFGQSYHNRLAANQGFDGALLVAPDGTIAEGAITNIALFDGTTVTWPDAPCLAGITMQLVEPRLPGLGLPSQHAPVRLADLPSCTGVFVTNSHGIAPVDRIDGVAIPVSPALMKTAHGSYESVPWDPI
jgi:branched-subunit amino acid aminotransferase/4-amino-4-deoxychorismate lyase